MKRLHRHIGIIAGTWLIGSCGGESVVAPPPAPKTGLVTVSQDTATLVPAGTLQLSAEAKNASGEVLQRTFSWTTSDPSKAAVSNSGLVVGVDVGTATITATADGKSATARITVLEGGVVSSTGATLTLQSGSVHLVVPADALASKANLWIAASSPLPGDPDAVTGSAFDFGPPGMNFAKPVMVTIRYNPSTLLPGTEEQALELYVNSSSGWDVVPQSVVDLTAKTVSAPVSHFSTYAIRQPAAVAGIEIGGASPLTVGQSEQLTATVTAANGRVLNRNVTWSSSDPAVASINQTGLVTGVKAGGVTISASAGGRTSSVVITVNPVGPVAVASVTLSSPTTPMVVGASQVLTAAPKDASGATLSDRTVSWVSSNPAVLALSGTTSVSIGSGATMTVTAVGAGTATITATSETIVATTTQIAVNPAPPAAVNTVAVSPTSASLGVGATQQLVATLRDAAGNVLSGRTITWASESPAVASVSATGLVTALMVGGPIEILATSEGKEGASVITVTNAPPPPVVTVTLSTATTPMVVGATQQLTAQTRDANGNVLSGRLVTWLSSNNSVLTVSASGLVTAAGAGTATITATSESVSATTPVITVNPAQPPPVVTVGLSSPTTPMTVGATQVVTATPRDGGGSALSGRSVNWVSSNTAVLTVSAASSVSTSSGATVTITAAGPGTATITATSEAAPPATTPVITVNAVPPPPVNTVTVTPASATLQVDATQQLVVTLRDAAGNVLTGRTVTWASESHAVASVNATGLVTAAMVGGPIEIVATSEGKTGASVITVTNAPPPPVASVTLSTATTPMVVGTTQQLTAQTRDANGNVLSGRLVTWGSSNNSVLTVSASGLVTAAGVGTATITATSESASATTPVITVNPVPVAAVTLSVPTTPMVVGATQVLTATPRDAGGSALSSRTVNWVSSNTAVLTVSTASSVSTSSGATVTVTAVGPGTATITATSEAAPAVTTPVITVNAVPPAPVNTVTLTPTSASIVVGATQQLTATLRDAGGNVLTGRTITWASESPTVASVTASGLVTALDAGGPIEIVATSEGKQGSSSITVTASPPPAVVSVALSTPTTPMVVGATQVLTAMPRDAAGATLSGRTVNWVSSNTAVLTVSTGSSVSTSSGATVTVTATGQGTATITATSETAPSATTPLIAVNPVPVATVTVAPASASIVVGSTQQLTATLRDANNNPLTGRTITWISGTPALATVDANGLVTAVGVGGPVTITATSEGRSGASSITITAAPPPPVVTVALSSPTTPMIVGETQVLTAMPRDAGGATLSGRTVSWVSSDPSVLTLSVSSSVSTATGATVTVTATGVGTATITATSEAAPGVTTPLITVDPVPVATVTVTPGSASIVVGATQQLSAETKDAGGNVLTGRTVTWTSANTSLATVDAGGLVTGVAAGGPVTITATSEGQTGTSSITVNPVPVASVTLSTATTPMVVGATQQLTAVTRDANGNVLSGRLITWLSSNTAVLTVSASGLVTAAGVGTATITATSESVSATTPTITVNPAPPPPVNTVTVTPASATLAVGGTQQLAAVTRDAGGNILTGRTITWSSSNNAVATVNSSGLVSAAGAGGPITITATSEGQTGTSSITVSGSLTIRANPFITSGLSAPTFLTQPLNDGRIFVVQQGGVIRVVRNGALQATPFLDITSRVLSGGERGLLSVAFHPQYATNHYFYVYFTSQTTGDIRIERFTTTANPEVADPATSKLIFTTPHPNTNHNGGLVAFGPDGMLYAAFGDGGGGSPDQDHNGQNFNAYLAGMIRINVDVGDPYSVPSDNPFVGMAGRRPELWAKGFRNPWRYAFDAPTGLLFIADVGEALREEVDAVPATAAGLNYGWSIMEGSTCFNATNCDRTGLTMPILDYGHSPACSITGGYVYRGSAMPAVQGHYFYSDFCAGWLRSLRYQGGTAADQRDWGITSLPQVKSFGQDYAGELYIISSNSVYKLAPGP